MTDVQILVKEPIAISQLAKFMKEVKKEERAEIQSKILDYSKKTSKLTDTECGKLIEEIQGLNLPGMTSDLIVSIANVMPLTMAELRSVLSGKSNISPESFKKIHEVLLKFKK